MSQKIAFIGFGEVGQLFAEQLARTPHFAVSVYDVLFENEARGPDLKRRAEEIGVVAAESTAHACRDARIVISAVTADSAVTAARQAAASLDASQIYVDLNSVSPNTKRNVAEEACRYGAGFVEFAVMAPVAGLGIAVPILAGGKDADVVAGLLNGAGMAIKTVGPEIGTASATKLCRSIVIKGLEALMVDLNLVTEKIGVLPGVLASLTASYPGMDWAEVARVMPTRVGRHGRRRAAEMREVSAMMRELDLDGTLADAVAARQHAFAEAQASDAGRKATRATEHAR